MKEEPLSSFIPHPFIGAWRSPRNGVSSHWTSGRARCDSDGSVPEGPAMTRRSRAREVALQLLFQRDFSPDLPRTEAEQFTKDRLRGDDLRAFCLGLRSEERRVGKEGGA